MSATNKLTCSECESEYDDGKRRPLMLKECGHTFCASCIAGQQLEKVDVAMIACFKCNVVTTVPMKSGHLTNHAMLEIITQRETRVATLAEVAAEMRWPISNSGNMNLVKLVKEFVATKPGATVCHIRGNVSNSGLIKMPALIEEGAEVPPGKIVCHVHGNVSNSGNMKFYTKTDVVMIIHGRLTNSGLISGPGRETLQRMGVSSASTMLGGVSISTGAKTSIHVGDGGVTIHRGGKLVYQGRSLCGATVTDDAIYFSKKKDAK